MYIYYIQNKVNDKTYIGSTTQKRVKVRHNQHRRNLNKERHCNPILQNSGNKHGEDNFEFGVLEEGFESIEELNTAEEFGVANLRSRYFQAGYNILPGGNNREVAEITKKRMSESHKGENNHRGGKTWSDEQKKKNSKLIKEWHENNTHPLLGTKRSDMRGENNPMNQIPVKDKPASKPVKSLLTGEEFDSIRQAAESSKVSTATVTRHCKNKVNKPRYEFINK